MRLIEILKIININLGIHSYFKCNDELISAEFECYQLKNTSFEFDYKRKNVLHFTNIESARLILENNYLRGSSFDKFNDKFEIIQLLSFINNELVNDWAEIKANTFAISFTEKIKNNIIEDYEYHWQRYGDRHQGVALEFEFSDTALPYGFCPLRINYLSKDSPTITKLSNVLPDDFNLSEVEKEFLLPILASIKDKGKFEEESEVRLMYKISKPEIEHLDNSLDSDIFFSFKENNALNLELRVPFSTLTNRTKRNPLKLKKIYLGKYFINSEDNIASSILMSYFNNQCEKQGIELIY